MCFPNVLQVLGRHWHKGFLNNLKRTQDCFSSTPCPFCNEKVVLILCHFTGCGTWLPSLSGWCLLSWLKWWKHQSCTTIIIVSYESLCSRTGQGTFIYSHVLGRHLLILKMPKTEPDSIAISIAFANQQHLVFKAVEGFYEFKTSISIQRFLSLT